MKLTRRRFITISAGLALAGLPSPASAKTVSWRGIALGADAKLVITGVPKTEAVRLIKLARREIERLENIFSLYRTDSALHLLNSTGELLAPPPELLSIFSQISAIHTATDALFDPTIQPLWQVFAEHGGAPDKDHIAHARKKVGWQYVDYNSDRVAFTKPGMRITLNGIAQGFITDRITALLRSEGLQNAIVNMGEVSAMGHKPDGTPWQVGLAANGDDAAGEFVDVANKCVATSAPMGTTFDGVNSHIICPSTGLPVLPRWQRISIVHGSASIADGLSTAGVLMDEAQLLDCVEKFGKMALNAKRADGSLLVMG